MAQQLSDFESSYNAITADDNIRKTWRKYVPITIEPAVFLFSVGFTLSSSVTTNLFLVHTCENSLGFNHSVCQELGDKTFNDTHSLEPKVQHLATYFTLGKTLIEAIIPAILSFYIGPWSDINGRKPIIMWPMLGYTFTYLFFLVDSLFPKLPVAVLLLSSLPLALSGGFISFISGMYSYISDVSKSDKRTLRLGMVEASLFGGLLVASLSVPHIYKAAGHWGYISVYATSATCCFLAWLYCCFFVQESVINVESEYPCCCFFSGLFKSHFVADMIGTCSERRPNNSRAIMMIIFIVMGCIIGTLEGESAVMFLFTREKFGWDLNKYSTFIAIALGINIVGLFFGTHILGSCCHFPPAALLAFAFFMKAIAAVVTALSPAYWFLYMASVIALPGACVGPWCRTLLSMTVPKSDLGKVFALGAIVEAVVPIASGPLYTLVYNATIQSFPGAVFILSGGIFIIAMLLILGVILLQYLKNDDEYLHSSLTEDQ